MFEVVLNDDGPQPKFDSEYSFTVTIDYIEMPMEELKDLEELEQLEKSIEQALEGPAPGSGEKAVELSDEAMAIASLPKIPGESPKQRQQRVKKAREQAQKIGYTFPGVSEDQLEDMDKG